MSLNCTHTFAKLEVSAKTFDEIKRKLESAGYDHTFLEDGNVIDMHGIGLVSFQRDTSRKGKVLNGKELQFAAKNKLPVFYVEHYDNPMDRHMNYNGICVMEKARIGYYIGNSDIDPKEFRNDELVSGEIPDGGTYTVHAVKGVKYSD